MEVIETKYGDLIGATSYDTFFDGQVNECVLGQENEIETQYGTFIPQYSVMEASMSRVKKRRSSICFYENGNAKSIALETQTIVKTPIGDLPAELVTFYKDGRLNRVFPLNGQINGFWSEEDEESLCEPIEFSFSFGSFSAKIIGIRFYETGEVKSISLWPGEVIKITTPQGLMEVRTGISLYKNGKIKSVEPLHETRINTPIGIISAHDNDVIGIHGDANSLQFREDGKVEKLTSYLNGLIIKHKNGVLMVIEPEEVPSYVDINELMIQPIKLLFDDEYLTVLGRKTYKFSLKGHEFKVKIADVSKNGCSGMCSSCSSCS